MNIVQVQFKNRYTDIFGGTNYSYIAEVPVSVGDIVTVPTARGESEAKVVRTDVPVDELPAFLKPENLKRITTPAVSGVLFDI